MSKDEDVIKSYLNVHLSEEFRKHLGESCYVPHRHCGAKFKDVDWGVYLKENKL